jgi:hypothetical protein
MSGFECKVSELNSNIGSNSFGSLNKMDVELSTSTSTSTSTHTPISSSGNNPSFEKNTKPDTNTTVNNFDKFLNEKNIKSILLIAVVYFFLHSEQVLEFVNSKIPSLASNLTLNTFGKIIFGLLIGICFVMYSFFFQGP